MKIKHDNLRIMGKDWHVIAKEDLIDSHGAFGTTEQLERRIMYSTEQTASDTIETLLHEIKHAQDVAMGLRLTEAKVHALGALDYQLYSDNPWLIELLYDHFIRNKRHTT